MDAEVEGVEQPDLVADLLFHLLQEGVQLLSLDAALDADHLGLLNGDLDGLLPVAGDVDELAPPGQHLGEVQHAVDVGAVDGGVDPLGAGQVVRGVLTPGVVGHTGNANTVLVLALDGVDGVAGQVGAVGIGHVELGGTIQVHEGLGRDVTQHDGQLIGSTSPIGHHQVSSDREQTDHPGTGVVVQTLGLLVGALGEVLLGLLGLTSGIVQVSALDVATEVSDLLDGHLPGSVHDDVGALDCLLDNGGITPLMLQLGIVNPQDGAAMAAGSESGGNPVDALFVDQVVATIQTVLVDQDQDFLLVALNSAADAVVNHVRQELPCLLGNTNMSHNILPP